MDGYLKTVQQNTPKHKIIVRVSKELRKLAMNRGEKIDTVYRNENGISYQMKSMESAFKGQTVYVPATKLFKEVVSIYMEDRQKYDELLKEVKRMVVNDGQTLDSLEKKEAIIEQANGSTSQYDEKLLSLTASIIKDVFPNGMRKSSQIAGKKFVARYKEITNTNFPDSVSIDDIAQVVGVEFEDKIYVPSLEIRKTISDALDSAKDNGYGVIYYEELYNAFLSQLSSAGVYSAELLKALLIKIIPNMKFHKTYACLYPEATLGDDIARSYRNDLFLSYYEIKNRLPYADLYQIRLACSRDGRFVSMGDEIYALSEKIQISLADVEKAKSQIEKDVKMNGFSMLSNIDVYESECQNEGVNAGALRVLLFDRYLTDLYSRKRSLITKNGSTIHMYDVMREYCLGHETITLDEIELYERDISGSFVYGLSAACDSMVRTDRTTFVHRDLIKFDIDGIDKALSLYVQDHIYPLADIPGFTSFPYVEGYPWNVFLLDSFCSSYSKQYRSLGGPAQKGIMGAIFPIYMHFNSYSELLTQVAADSGLELTDDVISDYFSKHRYLLRKSNLNHILANAQKIRLKEV